jgi:hypothetical protein
VHYILGGGIAALLAREILGPTWKIIPFGKSRFYTLNPPLEDDFIIYSDKFKDVDILQGYDVVFMKRGFSFCGELIYNATPMVLTPWFEKMGMEYNDTKAQIYRTEAPIYNVSCGKLYKKLLSKYRREMVENTKLGQVNKIADHQIITDKATLDYDKVISTIPLDAMCGHLGCGMPKYRTVYYHLVASEGIDLEGCSQVLVCDREFDFYKVNKIMPNLYMFYFITPIPDIHVYLSAFVSDFNVVNSTSVPDAVPFGDTGDVMQKCRDEDIIPVGDGAEHDYFMDVSSTINLLLKLKDDREIFKRRIIEA